MCPKIHGCGCVTDDPVPRKIVQIYSSISTTQNKKMGKSFSNIRFGCNDAPTMTTVMTVRHRREEGGRARAAEGGGARRMIPAPVGGRHSPGDDGGAPPPPPEDSPLLCPHPRPRPRPSLTLTSTSRLARMLASARHPGNRPAHPHDVLAVVPRGRRSLPSPSPSSSSSSSTSRTRQKRPRATDRGRCRKTVGLVRRRRRGRRLW